MANQFSTNIVFLFVAILGTLWDNTAGQSGQDPTEGETTTGGSPSSHTVTFMLYARELPLGLDYFDGHTDAYVIFYKNSASDGSWEKIMETEPVIDSRKPNWREIFVDTVTLNTNQKWRFDIWDFDPIGSDDYIGSVTIPADEIATSNFTFVPKKIEPSVPSSGYLIFNKIQHD